MSSAQQSTPAPRRPLRQRYPWLLPGGLLLLLVLLTVNAATNGPLLRTDRKIRKFARVTRNSPGWRWLDGRLGPARLLADVSNPWLAISVLMVVAAVVAARRRTVRPVLTAATAVGLLAAIVVLAKSVIDRLNPSYNQYSAHTLLDGFPSGHAAAAYMCYILAVLIIAPRPGPRARRIALGVVTALALAAGLTLVWLGVHRFTEVVAGWALAALVVPLALRVTGPRAGRQAGRAEQPAVPRAVPASADRDTG